MDMVQELDAAVQEIRRTTQSGTEARFLRHVCAVVVGGRTSEYFAGSLWLSVLAATSLA
jgi:hypothetical protein